MYSVQKIMAYFKERGFDIKQGTVENFRTKLCAMGIIGNNQLLSQKHLKVLEDIVREKNETVTWEELFKKHIFINFYEELQIDFKWNIEIIIKSLIWQVKRKVYRVNALNLKDNAEDFQIFCFCIENFLKMEEYWEAYEGSFGTDGNSVTSFKIKTPEGNTYYIIGKYNQYSKNEDMHIFYSTTEQFDIMQFRYIGVTIDKDRKFFNTLYDHVLEE